MTLTDFLLARIADDFDASHGFTEEEHIGGAWIHYGERMRLEIEAKRRIVARHSQRGSVDAWMNVEWLADASDEERAGHCDWCTYDDRVVAFPCADLRDLALPYADHPDYREEWRP